MKRNKLNRYAAGHAALRLAVCSLALVIGVSATAEEIAELVIPWSGAGMPEEAINPPEGTVVKLAYTGGDTNNGDIDPSVAVDWNPDTPPLLRVDTTDSEEPLALATLSAPVSSEKVLRVLAGGGLPELALDPPEGTIIKLKLAKSRTQPVAPVEATPVDLVIPYSGGPLPAEMLSSYEGMVVGLVYGEATAGIASTGAEQPEDSSGNDELVIPYDGTTTLPDEAVNPPEGTIVKLIYPDTSSEKPDTSR